MSDSATAESPTMTLNFDGLMDHERATRRAKYAQTMSPADAKLIADAEVALLGGRIILEGKFRETFTVCC